MRVPDRYDESTVCLSVDVEWAAPEVLADLVALLDERELKATFFVTHEGVKVPGHERAIHPNFRSNGDVYRKVNSNVPAESETSTVDVYSKIVDVFKGFAPESLGVRGHSLHYDSSLLSVYHEAGLQYDSTYQMALLPGLTPFWKEYDILEMPIFFNDFFELKTEATGFDVNKIDLEAPGLKVFDMHPNTIFINAVSLEHYLSTKDYYRDADRLLELRNRKFGIRTLFLDLLDRLASGTHSTLLMGAVNAQWRAIS